jgi:DMSO/TMAO reductase YedYZ heme-binding membrane subunit
MLGGFINILAALCGVMGILTATDVLDPLMTKMDFMFWFVLAAILFLATIAMSARKSE